MQYQQTGSMLDAVTNYFCNEKLTSKQKLNGYAKSCKIEIFENRHLLRAQKLFPTSIS